MLQPTLKSNASVLKLMSACVLIAHKNICTRLGLVAWLQARSSALLVSDSGSDCIFASPKALERSITVLEHTKRKKRETYKVRFSSVVEDICWVKTNRKAKPDEETSTSVHGSFFGSVHTVFPKIDRGGILFPPPQGSAESGRKKNFLA